MAASVVNYFKVLIGSPSEECGSAKSVGFLNSDLPPTGLLVGASKQRSQPTMRIEGTILLNHFCTINNEI